uniref:Uncharacterized protein n=1 Tax=Caenorhabditis tropicalis TaxID=1561998 RepID=A0A1I7TR08_9PELO
MEAVEAVDTIIIMIIMEEEVEGLIITIIIIHIIGEEDPVMEEDQITTAEAEDTMEEEVDLVWDDYFLVDYSGGHLIIIIHIIIIMEATIKDTVESLNSLIMLVERLVITVIVHLILQIINGINAFQWLLMGKITLF